MVKFSAVVISSQYNLHQFLVFYKLNLRIDTVSDLTQDDGNGDLVFVF